MRAFDPEAVAEPTRIYGDKPGLTLVEIAEEALQGVNALIVVTEWKNFWSPDFDLIKNTLKDAVIFDGRNLYEPGVIAAKGFQYFAVGRNG